MYLFKGHVLVNFPYCGDQIFNKKRLRGGGAYYRATAPHVWLERYIPRQGKHGGGKAWRRESIEARARGGWSRGDAVRIGEEARNGLSCQTSRPTLITHFL